MTTLDIRAYNLPKLIDKGYEYFWPAYTQSAEIEATFRKVCDTTRPRDFDPNSLYYRAVAGVYEVNMYDREEGEELKNSAGAFDDYYFMMKRRRKAALAVIPDDAMRAGENRMMNWLQEFASKAAMEALREQDAFAAGMWANGVLTAGSKTYFNNSVPGFSDPYPGFIYDNQPWFDTAHVQSSRNTSSTYANHTASLAFSRTNLKTIFTTMTKTNAYDRSGRMITIQPNMIVIPPDLLFSVNRELGAEYEDADMQPNVIATTTGWKIVTWRRLTDTDGWYIHEAPGGGGCPDVLFIENWLPPELRMWFDEKTKQNMVSFEFFFGAVVRDWRRSYCCNVAAA